MNEVEANAQWTPLYENVIEAVREAEKRATRWEKTLFWIDMSVASLTLGYLIYVLL